jgi:hypothetical protein
MENLLFQENSNLNQTPAARSEHWGGVTVFNGITKPEFFFKPSYNNAVSVAPRVKKNIQYGDELTFENKKFKPIH